MAHRHVALIVRTEVRRRIRGLEDDPATSLAYAVAGLLGAFFGIAVVGGAFFAGRVVASGDVSPSPSIAAPVAAGVLALATFTTGVRAIQHTAVPANADGLLLAARHRDVVVALLAVETLLPLGMIGVPGVLASLSFAAGAGSPASAVLVSSAVLLLVVIGAVTGYVLGLGVRIAIARSTLLARYKSGVGLLLLVGYFVVLYGTEADDVFAPVIGGLSSTPLRWFGDLALLALSPAASAARAAAIVGFSALALVALVAGASRLATSLWYSTPVEPYAEVPAASVAGLPGVGRRTNHVVRKTWTRARRSPIRLVYVGYPLLFSIGPVLSSFDGSVPTIAAPSLAVYGAWATGAAFTLNPIGDETPVLPVTLTTTVTGRQFVGALWLAGGVVGVPITVLFSVGAGVLAGLEPADLVLVAALAAALPALAPGLAAGVGAAFPRLEPARVTRSRRAVVPSLVAFGGYSTALLVLSAPAWLALAGTARRTVASHVGTSPLGVGVGSAIAAVVLVVGASWASYRYGARTFDEWTIA